MAWFLTVTAAALWTSGWTGAQEFRTPRRAIQPKLIEFKYISNMVRPCSGTKKIPRYQILTTEGILERGEQAIIPENWLMAPETGVGKAVKGQTETLFDNAQPTRSD